MQRIGINLTLVLMLYMVLTKGGTAMCSRCQSATDTGTRPRDAGRLRLWEFTDNAHCPVVGTCLSHNDLTRIARSLRIVFDREAQDYDVHGHFVRAATMDTPEARAMTKVLDERFAGALRLVKREGCTDRLRALWLSMKEQGSIAAGFWAFMTHRHIAPELRGQIFGEVHMLSHLMGASARSQSAETAALKARIDDLVRRRERAETAHMEALAERDATIVRLKGELADARQASAAPKERVMPTAPKPRFAPAKMQRALEIARARARSAEAELEMLKQKARSESRRAIRIEQHAPAVTPAPEASAVQGRLGGRTVLYVGGHNRQMPHLQKIAETFGASLLHHDGGLEDAVTRIDDVLPSVDCVLCPIDCVSHDACLRAKQGCKRLGKDFVPLRSASKACLRHALLAMMEMPQPAKKLS
jgi:hypothetical protein